MEAEEALISPGPWLRLETALERCISPIASAFEWCSLSDGSALEKGLLRLGMSPVAANLAKGFWLCGVAVVFARRIEVPGSRGAEAMIGSLRAPWADPRGVEAMMGSARAPEACDE